ncbi:Crp/Fnr family transcriptional regulator [Zhouia sp. PK063]|uniref:Crp/Fnr family transcriptional regulator n=1 Tax=Zhouia sp. PK063 TaxID=3373602 RepID=UPI0037917CCE
MDMLINYLLQFGSLNTQQIELVKSKFKIINVPKETYIYEAGNFVNELCFLKSGITRVCYYNHKGDEITKYFIDEFHFTTDANSFLYKMPTTAYVQTVLDCELYAISRNDFEELSNIIISWDKMFLKIITKGMADKVDRISPMLAETAKERYLNFMERYPNLINRIPLSLIASFLGITTSSLSRIRRSI